MLFRCVACFLYFARMWTLGGREWLSHYVVGCGNIFQYRDPHSESFIFLSFSDPPSPTPKVRPALRKPGRTFSKLGSFVSKSQPYHLRGAWKLATQRKSATRFAQARSHFSNLTSKKERDPLCTGQEVAKARNTCICPGAKQVAPNHSPLPSKIVLGAIGSESSTEFH